MPASTCSGSRTARRSCTATVNPDFGQVESDDLVVNFDATETFISDKRPFFTENQGIFEFTTPSDFSQLLYTRRVGGPADDGNGSGDITAALKLNGSIGATKYGVFAADEADAVGRTFGALRLVRDFSTQNLGLMATNVDRPFLDRKATVRRRRSQLAADRALERAHAPDRQRDRAGRREQPRHRRDDVGRLRDGSRLAPAVDRHALRQRPADQRRRLPLAQQHQLRALAGESPLHRSAGRVALRVEGLALARQHRLQRSRRSCSTTSSA